MVTRGKRESRIRNVPIAGGPVIFWSPRTTMSIIPLEVGPRGGLKEVKRGDAWRCRWRWCHSSRRWQWTRR